MSPDRLAVVDLGSNSFRLVVFEIHHEMPGALGGWWKRTDEIYEPVRIGAGVDETGALGEDGMARASAAIEVFAHFCDAAGLTADEVDVVATSAIREASNSEDFLARAREASGLAIRVLSREEEARYGYLAAINSTDLHDGAVLDVGGGSLQLVRVRERLATDLDSWRLGAVRMTERFLPDDGPATNKQIARLREHVARKLERATWLQDAERLVGLGGTIRNLAAALQRALGVPEFGVQGYRVERAALDDLVDRLASQTVAERRRVPGIKPVRGDIALAGARRRPAGARVGGLRRDRGDRGGSARGDLLRACARRPARAAVRRRAQRQRGEPRGAVRPARGAHAPRRVAGAEPVRRARGRRPASRRPRRARAARRPPACCTTSASPSTTTTTTSTRAT